MPHYWLVTTSPENFKVDKETSGFTVQGLKDRHKRTVMKFQPGDKVVYYINRISKFGAIATITSGYYHDDHTKIWTDKDEIWPSRAKSKPEIVLEKDELLDIKRLIKDLSFIKDKEHWSLFVRQKKQQHASLRRSCKGHVTKAGHKQFEPQLRCFDHDNRVIGN